MAIGWSGQCLASCRTWRYVKLTYSKTTWNLQILSYRQTIMLLQSKQENDIFIVYSMYIWTRPFPPPSHPCPFATSAAPSADQTLHDRPCRNSWSSGCTDDHATLTSQVQTSVQTEDPTGLRRVFACPPSRLWTHQPFWFFLRAALHTYC